MTKTLRSKQRSSMSVKPRNHYCHSSLKQTTNPTYFQLQIVLQSVQKIKHNAQNQIKLLQKENIQLKIQRDSMRELLSGHNKKDSDIQAIQQKIQQKFKQEIDKYKTEVNELTGEKTRQQINLEKAISKHEVLEKELRQLNQGNQKKMYTLRTYEKCLQQIGFAINQQSEIEDKHQILSYLYQKNLTVPLLIRQYQIFRLQCKSSSETNFTLKSDYQFIYQQKQQYIQSIKELQTELNISKQTIQKGVEQIQLLSLQLLERQAQIRKQQELMNKSQKQSDLQIHNLHKVLQQTKFTYQNRFKQLQKEIELMSLAKAQSQIKQKNAKGLNIYQKIVGQVCQASQKLDYQRVSERIEYLQRFKSEYYYNVQKIQYLCKMLDI